MTAIEETPWRSHASISASQAATTVEQHHRRMDNRTLNLAEATLKAGNKRFLEVLHTQPPEHREENLYRMIYWQRTIIAHAWDQLLDKGARQ